MGAGVRDAMNLAWKIAGVHHSALAPDVLDTYEQERKPHTRHMIRLALNVGRAMTGGARVGNAIRRVVLPRLRLIPSLRDKVIDSTTPALPSSALVCSSRRRRQLGGTLCPNPQLRDGQRLDDVLGTGFSLITTRGLRVADEAALRQRGLVVLVAQPGDALGQWLRGGRATAALVRPDRTVMRAGRDVSALCGWASSVVGGRLGQPVTSAGRR